MCVWNGIVHSLCHISACLTRQNKSFSIFQCAGIDGVRRQGCSASCCLILSCLLSCPHSSGPFLFHYTTVKENISKCQTHFTQWSQKESNPLSYLSARLEINLGFTCKQNDQESPKTKKKKIGIIHWFWCQPQRRFYSPPCVLVCCLIRRWLIRTD